MNKEKIQLEQLVKGGEETLFSAILVSLSSIGAIIALIAILIIK